MVEGSLVLLVRRPEIIYENFDSVIVFIRSIYTSTLIWSLGLNSSDQVAGIITLIGGILALDWKWVVAIHSISEGSVVI